MKQPTATILSVLGMELVVLGLVRRLQIEDYLLIALPIHIRVAVVAIGVVCIAAGFLVYWVSGRASHG